MKSPRISAKNQDIYKTLALKITGYSLRTNISWLTLGSITILTRQHLTTCGLLSLSSQLSFRREENTLIFLTSSCITQTSSMKISNKLFYSPSPILFFFFFFFVNIKGPLSSAGPSPHGKNHLHALSQGPEYSLQKREQHPAAFLGIWLGSLIVLYLVKNLLVFWLQLKFERNDLAALLVTVARNLLMCLLFIGSATP